MIYIYYFFVLIILFLIYFYRKPYITSKFPNNVITSPAYGTIKKIIVDDNTIHIIIFLSLTDIHYQYYPISGFITSQVHDNTGKYELAYKLNKSSDNEKCITTMTTNIGDIQIIQIAGKYARRIYTKNKINEYVKIGDEIGMIAFGSRVDIIIPKQNIKLLVKENDVVNGVDTILCSYRDY